MIPKFRAWHKKEKRWIDVQAIQFEDGKLKFIYEYIDENREYDHKPEDFILMQSTGLKDKNGNEIFEGDIIRGKYVGKSQEVVFRDGAFRTSRTGATAYEHHFMAEVIGNIHEKEIMGRKG